MEPDMNIVREITGANYLEQELGYTGQGVRGEVFDTGVLATHCDFQSNPIAFHTPNGTSLFHGTATMGIAFGDGTCNPAARGMLPDGSPIFAAFSAVSNRYQHTTELVDPLGPYRAVFQTSSVGSPRTTSYTTVSAEMDLILFDHDLIISQSLSNSGWAEGRPEAWAKNIVSIGGVNHYDTLTTVDDCWCGSASTGPASDGRIKPDLVHFYDNVLAPSSSCNTCYGLFGGTSAATPIVAGCFGLYFQMWGHGVFGNLTDPSGDIFENRSHMTTAKAVLINTARQYPFSGPLHDLSRYNQGWGLPDLRNLYDLRQKLLVVDEDRLLTVFEVAQYQVIVAAGEPALKVTMTYADPPGLPYSAVHRINDLTLKVTSPSGVVYYGNHGLLDGNWSAPGGSPDTIDTVENVFVLSPEAGAWTVEVRADEVNADGHPETPAWDADFALVVSGVTVPPPVPGDCDGNETVDLGDFTTFVGCLAGPGSGPVDATCTCADMDEDDDVDLTDFALFQASFTE
jgi:hypothetical protein